MQIQEFVQPIMFHTTLNPKLWARDALLPEVQVKLLMQAHEFLKSLKMEGEIPLVDIIITGSNTALTYTPQSDLDLHIIVDMDKIHGPRDIVEQFFDAKKRIWNQTYDIQLHGIPVEIYVEDNDETVQGNKYSLVTNQWLQRIAITKTTYNDRSVRAKFNYIKRGIERAMDRADSADDMKRLMDKIRTYRKSGLDKFGEFATENLVFKALRNDGWLEKIKNRQTELMSQTLSLD